MEDFKIIDDILSADEVVDNTENCVYFGGVTFKKDFGPWKANQKIEYLNIDFEHSIATECTKDGDDTETKCNIALIAVV